MSLREEVLELLRTDQAFREEVRRQLMTEEVLALPALVQDLVEAQRRTTEQVRQLAEEIHLQGEQIRWQGEEIHLQGEHIRRQGEQIHLQGEHIRWQGEQIHQQGEHIQVLAQPVQALVSWQRGEAGRRDGERYEREIVRRAPVLFNGGRGGSPEQLWVQQRLTETLGPLLSRDILPAEEDPFLADLVWWKGEETAVVEVSLTVNADDVRRAAQRAATLRQAGAIAFGMVIGDEWGVWETRERAVALRVEWKVGAALSEGFMAFRRLPTSSEDSRSE